MYIHYSGLVRIWIFDRIQDNLANEKPEHVTLYTDRISRVLTELEKIFFRKDVIKCKIRVTKKVDVDDEPTDSTALPLV